MAQADGYDIADLTLDELRLVLAPSIADIHRSNCMKNGVLPVILSREECDTLRAHMHEAPGAEIDVDLETQTVTALSSVVDPTIMAARDQRTGPKPASSCHPTIASPPSTKPPNAPHPPTEWTKVEPAKS